MQEWSMATKSRLNILIAEYNLARAREGLPALSARAIAQEMDVTHTRFLRIKRNGEPWDLELIDKCMQFFQLNSLDELFEYTEVSKSEVSKSEQE